MAPENPHEHPTSKTHRAISIIIPLLPILVLTYFAFISSEFREYVKETAYDGFYLAKEAFEMIEFMVVVLCGIIICVAAYAFHVIKLKKIAEEDQEKILQFINNEKSLILLGIVLLLMCILVYAPYEKYKIDQENIKQLQAQLVNKKSKPLEPKPLPDKIIPSSEFAAPTIPAPRQTNDVTITTSLPVASVNQFENFNADTGDADDDISNKIAQIRAEAAAKKEADHHQRNLAAQQIWQDFLPYCQRSIVVLRDVLSRKASKVGDGIAQSSGYFQCLPPAMDCDTGGIQIAEIRFQKNTNMSFLITVDGLHMDNLRPLIISCNGGILYLEPHGATIRSFLHLNPDIDMDKSDKITNADNIISQAINDLVAGESAFLSNANK